MSLLPALAESSSFGSAIHFVELLMGITAVPAVVGFFVLFWHHFRIPGAEAALFLGWLTVLLASGLCGFLWWQDCTGEWYQVPGTSLLVGLLVCALAWYARRTKPSA